MFKCGLCAKQTVAHEKQTHYVVETRVKYYDNGGVGYETVLEIGVCAQCAKKTEDASCLAPR
jgi:hypothetical protein